MVAKDRGMIGFHYERDLDDYNHGLGVCVNYGDYRYYPLSYTIEEALEDYCDTQGWDFHHIQFGTRLEEGEGEGRFYYYRMVTVVPERLEKQIAFSWRWVPGARSISLDGGDFRYFDPLLPLAVCLQKFCNHQGWEFISSGDSSTRDQGGGLLRYRE